MAMEKQNNQHPAKTGALQRGRNAQGGPVAGKPCRKSLSQNKASKQRSSMAAIQEGSQMTYFSPSVSLSLSLTHWQRQRNSACKR